MNIMEQNKGVEIADLEAGTIYKDKNQNFFKIDYLDAEDSPRESAGVKMMTFYTWVRGYESPDPCTKTFEDFCKEFNARGPEWLLKNMREKGYYVKPVYALIHSGIHYSLNPFEDRWDSGFAGLVFCERNEGIYNEEFLDKAAQEEVSEYDAWANGEIYVAKRLDDEASLESISFPFFARNEEEWCRCLAEAVKSLGIKLQKSYEEAQQKIILR